MVGVSKDSYTYRTISYITVVTYFITRVAIHPWQWFELITMLLDPEITDYSSPFQDVYNCAFSVYSPIIPVLVSIVCKKGLF